MPGPPPPLVIPPTPHSTWTSCISQFIRHNKEANSGAADALSRAEVNTVARDSYIVIIFTWLQLSSELDLLKLVLNFIPQPEGNPSAFH